MTKPGFCTINGSLNDGDNGRWLLKKITSEYLDNHYLSQEGGHRC